MTIDFQTASLDDLKRLRAKVLSGERKSGPGLMSALVVDGPQKGLTIGQCIAIRNIDAEIRSREPHAS